MKQLAALLHESAALHDHLCPRQVLGVRTGLLAAQLFGRDLPQSDKRLFAFVESDGCYADGVSVSTGCTLGRRTLRLVDYGKVATTLVDTHTGKALRIAPHPEARKLAASYAPAAIDRWHAQLDAYQIMPDDELLVAQPVSLTVSLAEIISKPGLRVDCSVCGEEIRNEREIMRDGLPVCRHCAGLDVYYSATSPGSISADPKAIVIAEYNPEWPVHYEQERDAIVRALGSYASQIEHIGSTSVPGLGAKRVIDIGIDLKSYPLPAEAIAAMEVLGYDHMGEYGIPGRHYFRKSSPRRYHVHAYSPGNPEWEAHILFRDYLRSHPDAARQYEELKRELAARHTDGNAYAKDKTDFVRETLAKAKEWRSAKAPQGK